MESYSHHGQFIKAYLDRLGFNKSAVARNSALSKQGLNDVFKRDRLSRDLLERIGEAVDFDFIAEFDRQAATQTANNMAAESQPRYETLPDVQIIFNFNLDDEERVEKAAELIRFMQTNSKEKN